VSSPLTITSTAGLGPSKGAGASAEAEKGGDAFAALLGASGKSDAATPTKPTAAAGNGAGPASGSSDSGAGQNEDSEAVAALIDAIVPPAAPSAAVPALTFIIDGLAELKASLAAGEPLDPELLKSLQDALDALAAGMDIDLDALPSVEELSTLAAGALPDATSPAAQLTAALAPLAQTLMAGGDPAIPKSELKAIGDRVAALLQALNGGAIDAEQLAQLGLTEDAPLDAELETALARLLAPTSRLDSAAATTMPVLASPELKLTEPVLTGKANVDASAPVDEGGEMADATPPAVDTKGAGNKAGERDASSNSGKSGTDATAAPVPTTEAQAGPQPQQAARADMVAAPRVVQAGYQTSQQQLNLPQLAFELVRQVNEGNTRFQIRLDPPELGKIDVRLDIDASGKVNARLTVEKAETLDLMQRDQRGLERALQQAGLDGSKANLEFSLKQNPFSGGEQGRDGDDYSPFGDEAGPEEDVPPPTVNLYRGNLSASGVNIIA
jgi:flagellar hook-length control protein FliK